MGRRESHGMAACSGPKKSAASAIYRSSSHFDFSSLISTVLLATQAVSPHFLMAELCMRGHYQRHPIRCFVTSFALHGPGGVALEGWLKNPRPAKCLRRSHARLQDKLLRWLTLPEFCNVAFEFMMLRSCVIL